MESFRSGFVAIVGEPNVGKSTLLNHLLGQKVAITSHKPQTTRNRIRGILSQEAFQIVFLDTPGLHKPKNKLGRQMQKAALSALREIDVVLLVVPPKVTELPQVLIDRLDNCGAPVILAINKADTVEKAGLLPIILAYEKLYPFKDIVPISAKRGENTDRLVETVVKYLPFGPKYFPDDMITDQPERQICAEMIREKTLILMSQEIPHGIAVEIASMKQRPGRELMDIDATIFCEKDGHKAMIIGAKGAMLKQVGERARKDIERLLGMKVNLSLFVKVRENWRDSDFHIRDLGLDDKN